MQNVEEVPFSIKGIRKWCLFCLNSIQKGKGLDIGTGPPRIKLWRVPHLPLGTHLLHTWVMRGTLNVKHYYLSKNAILDSSHT